MAVSGQTRDPGSMFESAAERELTTPRAAGVAGIVFSALFVLALVFLRQSLGRGLDTPTVMRNLTGPGSTLALAGLYIVPFAGIAFLWFIGVVRDRIGEREDKFFATVFFGSGLLFVAMIFAAAAVIGGRRRQSLRPPTYSSVSRVPSATRSCSSTRRRWPACSRSPRRRSCGARAGRAGRI